MEFIPLTINGTTAVVPLTQGKFALIDADAWPVIGLHMWQAHEDGNGKVYAVGPKGIRMHQLLCHCPPSRFPDHRDGNTLDNRRQNLRPATKQQNNANGRGRGSNTGYKGAYFDRSKGKYVAKIMHEGKLRNLGHFDNPVSAAKAYDEAARRVYGEFARTNF